MMAVNSPFEPRPSIENAISSGFSPSLSWIIRKTTAAIEALSEKDIEGRRIVRSDFDESFFSPLPKEQLDTYREALLIFYGKVSVYLKSMGKTRSKEWRDWIG